MFSIWFFEHCSIIFVASTYSVGISERKAKEKEELRSLILRAAKKLFVEQGIEQTTIRNIANEIEYSVGTVYVYFKDKNDILNALHSQGFMQLGGDMKVLHSVSDPMERVKALGRVYLQFAIENPDMYDLMFNMNAPIDCLQPEEKAEWSEGKRTFDILHDNVGKCMEAGHFKGHEQEALSFVLWSVVHGMASLYISKRIKGVDLQDPDTMLFRGYESFVMMLDKE